MKERITDEMITALEAGQHVDFTTEQFETLIDKTPRGIPYAVIVIAPGHYRVISMRRQPGGDIIAKQWLEAYVAPTLEEDTPDPIIASNIDYHREQLRRLTELDRIMKSRGTRAGEGQ